jgi:hypothetical protein
MGRARLAQRVRRRWVFLTGRQGQSVHKLLKLASRYRQSTAYLNGRSGAGSSKSRTSPGSLLESVNLLGSRPSKLNDGYGESCRPALQREPSFAMSQKFQTSSPERSLPSLIQLGHSAVPENQEQSFNRRRQLSWLTGSCAAQPAFHERRVIGSSFGCRSAGGRGLHACCDGCR